MMSQHPSIFVASYVYVPVYSISLAHTILYLSHPISTTWCSCMLAVATIFFWQVFGVQDFHVSLLAKAETMMRRSLLLLILLFLSLVVAAVVVIAVVVVLVVVVGNSSSSSSTSSNSKSSSCGACNEL